MPLEYDKKESGGLVYDEPNDPALEEFLHPKKYVRNPFTGELKEVGAIGPDLSRFAPAGRAFLADLPGAAVGAAATGQAMAATQPLRDSPYLPARVAGTLGPLAYGAVAAMGAGALTRKAVPVDIQKKLAEDAEEHKTQVLLGGLASQLPFFRPGALEPTLAEFAKARAVPAAIGAGISGATGLVSGDGINPTDTLLAAASNAVLNKATPLGEAAMGLGAVAGGNKAASIVNKLGNIQAKGKGNVVTTNAVANDIALDPTQAEQAKSAEESAQVLSGLMPTNMASESAKALATQIRGLDPAVLAPEIAYANEQSGVPTGERAATLEGLMPQQPASGTLLAELMKMGIGVRPKGTAESALKPNAVPEPRPNEIPVEVPPGNGEKVVKNDNRPEKPTGTQEAGSAEQAGAKKKTVSESDFVGIQEGGPEPIELWNAPHDIKDANGKIIHPVDSTVSRQTLEKYGYEVPKAPTIKEASEPVLSPEKPQGVSGPTTTQENPVKGKESAPNEAPEFPLSPNKVGDTPYVDAKGRPVVSKGGRFTLAAPAVGLNKAGNEGIGINPFAPMREPLPFQPEIVDYTKHDDGTVTVQALAMPRKGPDVNGVSKTYRKLSPQELEGLVGRDLSKRILSGEGEHVGMDEKGNSWTSISNLSSIDFGRRFGPESGAIINPREVAKALSERASGAIDRLNDPILERMAKVDDSKPSIMDTLRAANPMAEAPKAEEPAKAELTPANPAEEAVALANRFSSKTRTRKAFVTARSEEPVVPASEPDAESVSSDIHSAPDEYKPFLTDLAARFPSLEKIPLGKEASTAIGWVAKGVKNKLGLLDENIRERSPRVFGALRDKIFGLNEQRLALSKRADQLGKDLRANLSKEDFINFQEAALSGDRERAETIIDASSNPEKLRASLEEHQAVMKELAQSQRAAGRDVPEQDFYFHRRIVDRDGLLKALGSDGENRYLDLVRQAKATTPEEKDAILDAFIQGSMRNAGKPGYLKPRTIETISKDLLKYYEPIDVATHDYVMSTTRDISNRAFFGKDKEGDLIDWTGDNSIGKVLREEVEAGRLDRKGFESVSKALQSYFNNSTKYDKDIAGLAGAIRRAQTRLYLGDISTVLPQYADILTAAYNYGPGATKNYLAKGANRIRMEDIGLHEGINQELDIMRRRNEAPQGAGPVDLAKKAIYYTGKAYDTALKKFLGRADKFNKEGIINTAFKWVNDVVQKPDSDTFKMLDKKYSQQFPEKWPEILESLRSKEFANGKLDRNARFFLFNELMNLQPLDPAGRAQGYNEAGPLGKALYTLRSYALTQINILRRDAYNNLKSGNAEQVAKGLGNLGLYLGLVGAGGATLSYARDKFLRREEPNPLEYATTGLLQLVMIPRFAVMKAKEEGPLMAALQTAIPGLSAGKDFWQDGQLLLKAANGATDKSGRPLVDGFEDFMKQSRTLQYAPAVGRELYWWMGRGARSEQKAQNDAARGKPRKSTFDAIEEMFNPPDLKTNRRD